MRALPRLPVCSVLNTDTSACVRTWAKNTCTDSHKDTHAQSSAPILCAVSATAVPCLILCPDDPWCSGTQRQTYCTADRHRGQEWCDFESLRTTPPQDRGGGEDRRGGWTENQLQFGSFKYFLCRKSARHSEMFIQYLSTTPPGCCCRIFGINVPVERNGKWQNRFTITYWISCVF